MGHLLRHPPCGRMPSILLYGDSDIGKTMIIDKFVRDHPNICNEFGEVEAPKFLRLQMPSKPNEPIIAPVSSGAALARPRRPTAHASPRQRRRCFWAT